MIELNPWLNAYRATLAAATAYTSERRRLKHGICGGTCDRDRTDSTRLPWETEDAYGGWGGHAYHNTDPGVSHTPVIFVHGSERDACDWTTHAADLLDRGYTGDELWAITFNRATEIPPEMAAQLDDFVTHVRDETGADHVSLVGHSLGVTGIRHWLDEYDRYDWAETVICLAGANHGNRLAETADRLNLDHGRYRMCYWVRRDYNTIPDHPLTQLNADDETPGNVDYYTIRGADDTVFAGCKESPCLDGAEANVELPVDHEGVRFSPAARALIYTWLQSI